MKPKKNSLPLTQEAAQPPLLDKSLTPNGSFFMPASGLFPFYPECFKNHLTKKQQAYYQHNGHASLLKNLQVEVVGEINECQKLWEAFSPQITLFDTWDFRMAFFEGYRPPPHFLVLKNGSENLALLPLAYEKDKKRYTWFGSTWQEENKFLVKDPLFIPLLLAVCPSPVILNAISTELPLWAEKVIKLKPDEPKYILKLKEIKSVDDYFGTLKKKKRYNLKRDRKIIQAQNPQIIFDQFDDFETLVALSIKRFEQKGEDTDWEDPQRIKTFRRVIQRGRLGKSYQIRMISVKIGKKTAAVDLVALYQGCYYPLKCGYDVQNFPGIGNFVNLLEIDDAVRLGMNKMDFLEIGYGWKEKWFEAVPLLQYEKK